MHNLMRGIVVIAVLFASMQATAEAAAAKDCRLRQYASIDLIIAPDGLVLVPAMINDVAVFMALNIGSAFSGIYSTASERLKLQRKSLNLDSVTISVNSENVHDYAIANSVALGSLPFGKAEFLVVSQTPDIGSAIVPNPVVGTIGINFFSRVDFEFDFANRKLNLYSQDHCPGEVVYWADSFASVPMRKGELGEVYFLMELEGQKIQTVLSTGAESTILYTDASKALFNFDENSKDVTTETDVSGRSSSHYRAMALTADGLAVMNAKILLRNRISPKGSDCVVRKKIGKDKAAGYDNCYGPYPLMLGMNVLQRLHLYVATKEKMLYFTAADAKRESAVLPP
jgi:predicted aspartyl protease